MMKFSSEIKIVEKFRNYFGKPLQAVII